MGRNALLKDLDLVGGPNSRESVILTHEGQAYIPSAEAKTAFKTIRCSIDGLKCHKSGVYIRGTARGTRDVENGMFSSRASFFQTTETPSRYNHSIFYE